MLSHYASRKYIIKSDSKLLFDYTWKYQLTLMVSSISAPYSFPFFDTVSSLHISIFLSAAMKVKKESQWYINFINLK